VLVFEVVLYLGGCREVGGIVAFFGDVLGDGRCIGPFGGFLCVCHHGYLLGILLFRKTQPEGRPIEKPQISGTFELRRLYRSDFITTAFLNWIV
jgi:hypothetical protein